MLPYKTNDLIAICTGHDANGKNANWLVRFRNPFLNLLFLLPTTVISDECTHEDGPLLVRWHLMRLPGGRALMLHCFLQSDNARHYHDHPWSFATLLLSPYIEHIPHVTGKADRDLDPVTVDLETAHPRFSFLRRPASWLHWVQTIQPMTWTLIYHGPGGRPWGFATDRGWVPADEYVKHFPCGE